MNKIGGFRYDDIVVADGVVYPGDQSLSGVNGNVAVIGATGSGKTTSVVLPQLMAMEHESVVLSVAKLSDARAAHAVLSKKGYSVDTLNLASPKESTVGFDPLDAVVCQSDAEVLAKDILCASNSGGSSFDDKYWDNAAEDLIAAVILAIVEIASASAASGEEFVAPTFADVVDILRSSSLKETRGGTSTSSLDELIDSAKALGIASNSSLLYSSVKGLAPKTASCVFSTAKVAVSKVFPDSARCLGRLPSVDPALYGKERRALIVVTPPCDSTADAFVSLFYGAFFRALLSEESLDENGRLSVPVKFLLDDAACAAPVPNLGRVASLSRYAGISIEIFLQAKAQLARIYGDLEAFEILANCDTTLYMSTADLPTLKEIAERLCAPLSEVSSMPYNGVVVVRRGVGAFKALRSSISTGA